MGLIYNIKLHIKEIRNFFETLLDNALNPLGGLDVNIQDQTTPPIDFFFTQIKATPTTVAIEASVDDYDVNVTSASGCSIGDYVGIFNADDSSNNRAYFGTILNISVNVITLDTPLDFPFQVGNTFACFTRNINEANGSSVAEIFQIEVGPNATQSIDINRLMISFLTNDVVNLAKFGDLLKLTRGCVLRRVNGTIHNIWNVKDNGELANLSFDYDPYTALNPAQGQDGAKFRFTLNGQDKHGVAIRLNPGDKLQLIVQDDLRALQQFRIIGEGHYVD